MFNESYPNVTPASNLYENKADAESHHIFIPVNRVIAKAAVFTSPTFKVNGGGSMTDLKFGWRNLNNQFYFIQDTRDGLIKDYNWNSYAFMETQTRPLLSHTLPKMLSNIYREHPI